MLGRAPLALLAGLWIACFGFAVHSVLSGAGYPSVHVSAAPSPDGYPVLRAFRSYVPEAAASGLARGDRLLAVEGVSLQGLGALGTFARFTEAAGSARLVHVDYERQGVKAETPLALGSYTLFASFLPVSLIFAATALVLWLRAPSPSGRASAALHWCMAFACASFFGGSHWVTHGAYGVALVSTIVLPPLAVRACQVFGNDEWPTSRLARFGPWLLAPFGVFHVSRYYDVPFDAITGITGAAIVGVAGLIAIAAVLTRGYRRADAIGRRQLRWVVFGWYVVILPIAAAVFLAAFDPRWMRLAVLSQVAFAIVPLTVLAAVARYNLYDIDRIVSAAASYNVLLVVLVGGGLVVVPRLADAASELAGIDPGTGQIVLSLLLAGVVVPAHRRLRPQIDRWFFQERYRFDQGVAELLPALSLCSDVRALTEQVGRQLDHLLRPEACVLYAALGGNFVPVFVEGRTVPPAFESESPLVAALGERERPLALSEAGRRRSDAVLGSFDRAALETLHAEVVVPIHGDDALLAFLCLGPKRSGDVYTATDLSHLALIAATVAREIRRFGQEEMLQQAREMQEALRRYVPGAIAEQLEAGADLASAEREVCVLFADIRGYVSFSEARRAEEIFSTVNRYTETVSEIVRKHGGSVVEFNGDGMMAVFGAPRELAAKERAAVRAGREIVASVDALPVEDDSGESSRLTVGVGIATGDAFVGNIQAVDRMIWSAIGNTTNLAARLQELTRDFGARIVIDDPTWERARPEADDFELRPDAPIRGRRETQDLHALLLGG